MDQHYSAFISYKHAPADSAVALEIQKRLERYHVPAAIRKKTGKDKIGRIFRDKEELTITSDLSDDIRKALEDADFLIVICSSSTKLSTWVPREIKYFLEHHSKKRVLTVLVDGEPKDVIPEQLLTDIVTRTTSEGETFEEKVIIEPLYGDFRAGIKEARRTEITRLAAALLGCNYDELVMRERQYKLRRNLAIGFPVACATVIAIAYLVWSNQVITRNYRLAQENYQEAQANLRQAMINQATYLCTESARLGKNGDRLRAILLALEALPSEEGDTRPLTPRAQNALVLALDAYRAPGSQLHYKRIKPIAEYAVNGTIEDFFPTNDNRFVVVRDSYNTVEVWDAISYEKVLSLDDEKILDVRSFSDTSLAVLTDTGAAVYDILTGQEIWRFDDDTVSWHESCLLVDSGTKWVWLALCRDGYTNEFDEHSSFQLVGLEGSTGTAFFESETIEDLPYLVSVKEMVCTADGTKIAVAAQNRYRSGAVRIFIWDMEEEKGRVLEAGPEYYDVRAMCFPEEERLVVTGIPMDDREGGFDIMLDTHSKYTLQRIAVSCFDIESDKLEWSTSYTCFQQHCLKDGIGLNYARESRLMVSTYANKTCFVRLDDGVIEEEIEYTAPVVGIELSPSGYSICCLNNGSIGIYDPDQKGSDLEYSVFDYSNNGMLRFSLPGDTTANYLVSPDNHKIWFCAPFEDEAFVRYQADPMPKDTFSLSMARCKDTLAILNSDGCLYLFDLTEQTSGHIVNLEGTYSSELLGADEASGMFWIADIVNDLLLCISASDGVVRTYSSGYELFSKPQLLDNGRLAYWVFDHGDALVVAEVRDDSLEEEILLTGNRVADNYSIRRDVKATAITVDNTCYLADLESDDIVTCQEILKNKIELIIWGDPGEYDDRLAITDGYEVCILKTDGTVLARLSEKGSKVVSMTCHQGELIVLYGGGKLIRYNWSDGTLIEIAQISSYKAGYEVGYDEEAEWSFQDDRLYLICRRYRLLQIIDLNTWETETATQDGIAYDAIRDRIICVSEDDDTGERYVGYFPHYTVEDLRRKAQDALHGMELTQEERAMYGLARD